MTIQPLFPLLETPIRNLYPLIAIILLAGLVFGALAARVHLPKISGNIFAGLLMGPVFGIVDTNYATISAQIEPIINLSLSLIAISIGSHLRFHKLHNAFQRINVIILLALFIIPLTVFFSLYGALQLFLPTFDKPALAAAILSLLAIAPAPATIVHVIQECRASGMFVKTLMAVVVLLNGANIALFELAKEFLFYSAESHKILHVFFKIGGAVLLGILMALALLSLRKGPLVNQRATTFCLTLFCISYGSSHLLGLSPIITHLTLGIFVANFSDRNQILDIFEDFEEVIFALFFTLTGAHASLHGFGTMTLLSVIYLIARNVANLLAVFFAGNMTPLPGNVSRYLGFALISQAGITIGLIVNLESIPAAATILTIILPVTLTAITISELIGPVVLRFLIIRSKEQDQALPRLISFIQEEYIMVDLPLEDQKAIIEKLVNFLYQTHRIGGKSKELFLQDALEREKISSTAIGGGIAAPYATLPEGRSVYGVMTTLREGAEWESPDKRRVYMVLLLAIPFQRREQYLEIISMLTELFTKRGLFERKIHEAKTAAEVYEAIIDEEFESLNQRLDHDWS